MPFLLFRRRAVLLLSVAALFQAGNVAALGLMQAFDAALQNDPVYRAAIHENAAGQQFRVLGRSFLLPTMSFVYTQNQNAQDFTMQTTSGFRQYPSETEALQFRQPLFNLDSFARYKQGIAQTSQSEAKFSERSQDLIVRIVGAYADAKHAEDKLALAVAQLNVYAEQRQMNSRMFEKGEGTKTDMLETQSSFDLAEAQVIEARDHLANMRNVLSTVIGIEITVLDSLSDNFRTRPMNPTSFDEWKSIALDQNPEIIAQRHAVEVAREEINRQRAGHAPRIDLIAGVNRQKSDIPIMVGMDFLTRSIGVQVNVPLYSGGSVNALSSQAISNHEKAKADLDSQTNQVLIELRKQYNLALSSVLRIDALTKSVSSSNFLVTAMRESAKRGVRNNLDTLHAEQQLYTAKRDLALARYTYLLSYLQLRKTAGTVAVGDLQDIAGYFVASQ
jgi:protease secretion system outer membrane protein